MTPRGHLRLSVVGPDLIDVAAVGAFDESLADEVANRLDRLIAGRPGCVHIDCSLIASMDAAVVAAFVGARDRLHAMGGELLFSEAPRALRLALASRVAMPGGATVADAPAAVAS